MSLHGIHHLTSLTADMDRLIGFYERVFGARATLDTEEEGLRHAYIEVGEGAVLHPFQVPGVEVPQGDVPMFTRGRLDHFGLHADSEDSFWELRERVLAEGAGVDDAVVSDMGSILSFTYEDPDGARHEVIWAKPDQPQDTALRREQWRTLKERPEASD